MLEYNKVKALIVDDHMIIRNLMGQALKDIGLVYIETASNGAQAVEKIQTAKSAENPYNIIFLDWAMPDIDGLGVLKHFRSQKDFDSTAFIMLTAKQEEKDVISAIQSGATSYIVKPINQNDLKNHVDKTIYWLEEKNSNLESGVIKKLSDTKEKISLGITREVSENLKPIVTSGMENIFSSMFHVEIISTDSFLSSKEKEFICIGKLYQKDIKIALRFIFTKNLLKPLLKNLYSDDFLEKQEVYEDAASEIVNILCNQVKKYLNDHGYSLDFERPEMDTQCEKCNDFNSVMNVAFSYKNDDNFYVDLGTKD